MSTDVILADGSHTEAGKALHAKLARSALTTEQSRFLMLHAHHNVVKWVWHFQETMLRAYSERGHTATCARLGVEQLVALGLMTCGAGHAKDVTEAGRSAIGQGVT